MTATAFFLSMLCAACLGYAAQRGSLCAISGMATGMAGGSSRVFRAIPRASLWVMLVTMPACWLLPRVEIAPAYPIVLAVLVGGALFGMGAALNGGCSIGTLIRCATGDLSFLASLAGIAAGIATVRRTRPFGAPPVPLGPTALASPSIWGLLLLAIVLLLCLRELPLIRRGAEGVHWPPERAAMVMGVMGAILYLMHGSWTYGLVLDRWLDPGAMRMIGDLDLAVITAAIIAGAVVSGLQIGVFRLRADWRMIPLRLSGGFLMGFGAGMVPGGNGVLVLRALPALSPHAVPAYVAMMIAAAALLFLSRALRRSAHFPGLRSIESRTENAPDP